jgi:hypothetical protein
MLASGVEMGHGWESRNRDYHGAAKAKIEGIASAVLFFLCKDAQMGRGFTLPMTVRTD